MFLLSAVCFAHFSRVLVANVQQQCPITHTLIDDTASFFCVWVRRFILLLPYVGLFDFCFSGRAGSAVRNDIFHCIFMIVIVI